MDTYAIFNFRTVAESAQACILVERKANDARYSRAVRYATPIEVSKDTFYLILPSNTYPVISGEVGRVDLQLRPQRWVSPEELKTKRDTIQYGSFTYLGKTIQCRDEDRANINSAAVNAMMATDEQWPSNFAWRFADNSWLPMTRQQVLGMSAAFGQFLASCFAVFAAKTAQIAAGEPCDINTGWPE